MPRPTEIIQAEESTASRSPLRRSCRIIAVASPIPSEGSDKESTDIKEGGQAGPAIRGKRASSVTKENGDSNLEPAKTRSRRSSAASESSVKTENSETSRSTRGSSVTKETEPAKPRTRRSSASSESSVKTENTETKPVRGRRSSVNNEEEVTKSTRNTRNSMHNEKEEEAPPKKIRGRRSSAQDDLEEELPARTTRSRRSASRDLVEETKDAGEQESKRTTRSRRSSVDAEEEPVPKPVKTPMKPKRRLSVSETATILEPIDEKEEAPASVKIKNQNVPENVTEDNEAKNKELYIICETSFVEEDGIVGLTPRSSPRLRNEATPKATLEKSEHKGSPIVEESGGGRKTPDNVSLRKSPRIQEKLEKCKSGDHTPSKKCTSCDAECSNSPSRKKLDIPAKESPGKTGLKSKDSLDDIHFSAKVIHNDTSIQMKEYSVDDEVFTSETVVVVKTTETKCLISDGSDGSFQFNLSKSKYEHTESEGDLNESKTSDSSDKENAHVNVEKISKVDTAGQDVLEKLSESRTKPQLMQNITVNRVSNVFRPKNVDYSFVEDMDVDTTFNLDMSKLDKSCIKPHELSKVVDTSLDGTFSLNLSDGNIDKTVSNGSKTLEDSLKDQTDGVGSKITLNLEKESPEVEKKAVDEETENVLEISATKTSQKNVEESDLEISDNLKNIVVSVTNTQSENVEKAEKIASNEDGLISEGNAVKLPTALKENDIVTIESTLNIKEKHMVENISTTDHPIIDITLKEETEDDRFSETDERERSIGSKDFQLDTIDIKVEEEDDRFSETKDMSADYEFDVPSDTEKETAVILSQTTSRKNDTVEEDINDINQSSDKVNQEEDAQEIDVETIEDDREVTDEVKSGDNSRENISINGVDESEKNTETDRETPSEHSHENLQEISTDDKITEVVTSSVDNKVECSQSLNDSSKDHEQTDQGDNAAEVQLISTDVVNRKEQNNKRDDDYNDMECSFQDVVREEDEIVSEVASETLNTDSISTVAKKDTPATQEQLPKNLEKCDVIEPGAAESPDTSETIQTITDHEKENSSSGTAQSSHEQTTGLENEQTDSTQEKTIKNSSKSELNEVSDNSGFSSPKKSKKRKSAVIDSENVEKETVDNSNNSELELDNLQSNISESPAGTKSRKSKGRKSEITPENNTESENVELSKSPEISVPASPKKGKKRKSEISAVLPDRVNETNNQEQIPEEKCENEHEAISQQSPKLSEPAVSPKKAKKRKSRLADFESEDTTDEQRTLSSSSPALVPKSNKDNKDTSRQSFSLDSWFKVSTTEDVVESEVVEATQKSSKSKRKQSSDLVESLEDKKKKVKDKKPAVKNVSGKRLSSAEFLEQYEDARLDAKLEQFLDEAEDSESDEDDEEESNNSFLDDMAEEGEEDTPSEDSNAIIDEGEPINTDSERSEDDEYDEDSSFICDEGNTELLSGDEYDLGYDDKKRKSRIINVDDRNEEIITIKRKPKPEPKKKKSRIIRIEDSSESEDVIDLVSDREEFVSQNSEGSDQVSPKQEDIQESAKPKTSIRIIENLDVKEIRDTTLSNRINQLVDTFCTTIPQTGDVSMNLSLEYARKASPGENKKSKKSKSKDSQRKSISEEGIVSSKIPKSEDISSEKSRQNVPKKPRLSVSLTEEAVPSVSEEPLKRRLSKSMDDVEKESKKRKKKKSKKLKQKRESSTSSSEEALNTFKDKTNLNVLSFGLLNDLLTDVRNRPRRTVKPSTSRRESLDNAWIVELGVEVKPSTSLMSKKEKNQFKKQTIHPKDFRNQMLYNSSRVKRIETKELLKKKGSYY